MGGTSCFECNGNNSPPKAVKQTLSIVWCLSVPKLTSEKFPVVWGWADTYQVSVMEVEMLIKNTKDIFDEQCVFKEEGEW